MTGDLAEKIKAINNKEGHSVFVKDIATQKTQSSTLATFAENAQAESIKKYSEPNTDERIKRVLAYILGVDGALLALALGRFIIFGV